MEALERSAGVEPTASNISRISKATSDEAATWAFTQWELRRRARVKFKLADRMLFTREALEQATHEEVAAYHASRFPEGALVADLTCGIGADLIALAKRGPAIGYDIDEERARYARWNAHVHGFEVEVRVEDSLAGAWDLEYAFVDPARRSSGKRLADPNDFSPNPLEVGSRFAKLKRGGMKLSPMLQDKFLEGFCGALEFISFGGECREAMVWLGSEVQTSRKAVQVESGEMLDAGDEPVVAAEPTEFFFEADPAAIRAHCLGTLCDRFNLLALGDSNGYLTGDAYIRCVWLKAYKVLYTGKADTSLTKRLLQDLDVKVADIKQRGVGIDLQKLKKSLATDAAREVLLAVWPMGASHRHTIIEPV